MMKQLARCIAIGAGALALAACGGGGGGGSSLYAGPGASGPTGGGGTGAGSVVVALQDSAGAVISPPALTGTQVATVVVTVRNSSNAPEVGKLVAVSGDAITFTPTSGQQLTDSAGTARFQVQSSDPFAGGATIIGAAVTGGGQGQLAVSLGGATASIGAVTSNKTLVGAYETAQLSVPVTLAGTTTPAPQLPVTFSASCGTLDPVQAITSSQGVATTTYRNQSGSSACSGLVTLTALVGTVTSTTQVTAVAPAPANIQFSGASPARIYLAGSPNVSQSLVSFKLVDSSGNPVAGQNIDLALTLRPDGTYLGATAGTVSLTQSTSATGTVSVAVNAGSAPGPVQVSATLVSQPSITNVSNTLSVASGLPVQKAFSLSVSTFNIEALLTDGVTTNLTLRMADRLSNPVPDGSTVNFVAEGGQVVASCNTAGAATNGISACTVTLSSQEFRPADGRVTVLAWTQGEETFVDAGAPTNNVYDSGETFEDLGQPFLDKNENGLFDSGSDVTLGTASGSVACPFSPNLSAPLTCNGVWAGGALVRSSRVITFSGSDPFFTGEVRNIHPGNRCSVSFVMKDINGNPLPAGTTLAVANVKGGGPVAAPDASFAGFGGEGDKVPNTSNVARTTHIAVFSGCVDPAPLSFDLIVTTPAGIKTTKFF